MTCSLRSWPTLNARPVPVSTTQRTDESVPRSDSAVSSPFLVARSIEFIASGRENVMVATPSATLVSTAGPVMQRHVVPPDLVRGAGGAVTRLCQAFAGTE